MSVRHLCPLEGWRNLLSTGWEGTASITGTHPAGLRETGWVGVHFVLSRTQWPAGVPKHPDCCRDETSDTTLPSLCRHPAPQSWFLDSWTPGEEVEVEPKSTPPSQTSRETSPQFLFSCPERLSDKLQKYRVEGRGTAKTGPEKQ